MNAIIQFLQSHPKSSNDDLRAFVKKNSLRLSLFTGDIASRKNSSKTLMEKLLSGEKIYNKSFEDLLYANAIDFHETNKDGLNILEYCIQIDNVPYVKNLLYYGQG
jgi:hypothetical protein